MALEKRGKNWFYDFVVNGVRYRGPLKTTNYQDAKGLEHDKRAEAKAGKLAANKGTKAFARLKFKDAVDRYIEDRKPDVAPKTAKIESERARAINRVLGSRSVSSITPEDVLAYMRARTNAGMSNATVNRELDVIRGVLKRAKRWAFFAEDVKPKKKATEQVGRALQHEEKVRLLKIAALRPAWQAAYYASIIALNTTCRGCELKGLQWHNVDLIQRAITICKSKTEEGLRVIPLNAAALDALIALRRRAQELGTVHPTHYIFFACESGTLDPTRPQATWRTAWRAMTRAIRCPKCGLVQAPVAKCKAKGCLENLQKITSPLAGLRFHDLRHHAITELAESQTSEETIMSIAGHVSRKMLSHYSHVRIKAKRTALDHLCAPDPHDQGTHATIHATIAPPAGCRGVQVIEKMVDLSGIEPLASSLRTRRSPS